MDNILFDKFKKQIISDNDITERIKYYDIPLVIYTFTPNGDKVTEVKYIIFKKIVKEKRGWNIYLSTDRYNDFYIPLGGELTSSYKIFDVINLRKLYKKFAIDTGTEQYLLLPMMTYIESQPEFKKRLLLKNPRSNIIGNIIEGNWNIQFDLTSINTVKELKYMCSYIIDIYSKDTLDRIDLSLNNMLSELQKNIDIYIMENQQHPLASLNFIPFPENNDEKELYIKDKASTSLVKDWIYYPPRKMIKEIEGKANYYVSAMNNKLYKKSQRPVTSMSNFAPNEGETKNIAIFKKDPKGAPQAIQWEGNIIHVFPVSRYSPEKKKGLFYSTMEDKEEEEDTYCGTYYFWEPESEVYLILGKSKYFPNKLIAYISLPSKNKDNELINEFLESYYHLFTRYNLLNIKSPILMDIMLNGFRYNDSFLKEFIKLFSGEKTDLFVINDLYQTTEKIFLQNGKIIEKGTYMNEFDAFEDELDQPLCLIAKENKLDTIILAQQPGSRKINTEVLDARDRKTSFFNLVWRIE